MLSVHTSANERNIENKRFWKIYDNFQKRLHEMKPNNTITNITRSSVTKIGRLKLFFSSVP